MKRFFFLRGKISNPIVVLEGGSKIKSSNKKHL
jgi:hypothetical protein